MLRVTLHDLHKILFLFCANDLNTKLCYYSISPKYPVAIILPSRWEKIMPYLWGQSGTTSASVSHMQSIPSISIRLNRFSKKSKNEKIIIIIFNYIFIQIFQFYGWNEIRLNMIIMIEVKWFLVLIYSLDAGHCVHGTRTFGIIIPYFLIFKMQSPITD